MRKERSTGNQYKLTEKQKKYLPVKRAVDVVLSGGAILILSPVLGAISLAIKLESPGPVLFKQKRVGKDKELFEIWKFRSMRTDTPKDVPTHMLSDPDQYITKTGKFLRKTSLDELPQIFNIFKGEMSIIGPRPALWNQDDLITERDKYNVNSITPGLTGWAQINGRDELEIPVKARFDGEYVKKMSFGMDVKCFLGTIGSVLASDGVVEGGTGEMEKNGMETDGIVGEEKLRKEIRTGAKLVIAAGTTVIALILLLVKILRNNRRIKEKESQSKNSTGKFKIAVVGTAALAVFTALYKRSECKSKIYQELLSNNSMNKKKDVSSDGEKMDEQKNSPLKRILITGAGSYVGTAVEDWLKREPDRYSVDTLDMLTEEWRNTDFSSYDVVYHVAGIAHADVGKVTDEQKKLYYRVNTDLTVEVAEKAKAEGVKQLIFMSSMIVYFGCKEKVITLETEPKPLNFYGDSKWQADQKISRLADDQFKVVVLRPPMIYGKGSKGNYPQLAKLAGKLPVFPEVKNKRSMLHIDNLCEFIKLMIDNEESGIFFPQNGEYTNTSDMVQMIAAVKNHRIIMIPGMSIVVKIMEKIPGKIGGLAEKAFGDSAYDMQMSEYKENYRVRSLLDSIRLTEEQ